MMDETAIPTNANEQIAALREELHRERAENGRLHRDVEMVINAAGGGDLFSVADRLHAAHKQVHALRLMLTQDSVRSYNDDNWTDVDLDEAVGVEPRCAACHGYGPDSGQELLPITVKISLGEEFDHKPEQVDNFRKLVDGLTQAAGSYGFRIIGAG